MPTPEKTVKFTVKCLGNAECTVTFEPVGGDVLLTGGDWLTVEVYGPATGDVAIYYRRDGMTIEAWHGAETEARDRDGDLILI